MTHAEILKRTKTNVDRLKSALAHSQIPEVTFRVGAWYGHKYCDDLFCYVGDNKAYGFEDGKWVNDHFLSPIVKGAFKEVYWDVVEERLTAEAKHRGHSGLFEFEAETCTLTVDGLTVFNGKWHEIPFRIGDIVKGTYRPQDIIVIGVVQEITQHGKYRVNCGGLPAWFEADDLERIERELAVELVFGKEDKND